MEKETKKGGDKFHFGIYIAIIVVLSILAYNQYAIGAANKNLDRIAITMAAASASGDEQQTTLQGIGPELGITYDTKGYKMLLNYYKTIKLSANESKQVAGIDVTLPCCGFKAILTSKDGTSDFENSCHCGHHDAMYGLAKYMVQKGYSREDMQKEENAWKEVFFPASGGSNLGGCA